MNREVRALDKVLSTDFTLKRFLATPVVDHVRGEVALSQKQLAAFIALELLHTIAMYGHVGRQSVLSCERCIAFSALEGSFLGVSHLVNKSFMIMRFTITKHIFI